jgi:hypothetical protein
VFQKGESEVATPLKSTGLQLTESLFCSILLIKAVTGQVKIQRDKETDFVSA